jgi:hypothetical protein
MQADGQRLGTGDLAQRNVCFRHRRELAFAHDEALAEHALHVRIDAGAAEKAHVAAKIVAAGAAVIAAAARMGRIDGDLHARRHRPHGIARAQHDARRLMTGDEGFADDEGPHAAMQEIVQVGSADARGAQPQLHLVRRQRRDFVRFQAQVARPVDATGQRHGDLLLGVPNIGHLRAMLMIPSAPGYPRADRTRPRRASLR